jgi:hypothetical protein
MKGKMTTADDEGMEEEHNPVSSFTPESKRRSQPCPV